MPFYTDQLNRRINVTEKPQRIVSLVPSQTELLYDLGLNDEVIGITKFCIHPEEWFKQKTRIGGTKTVNINKVKELRPDLIIAAKEENVQEQIEELAIHFPVWVSDVNTLTESFKMIEDVGKLVDKAKEAAELIATIQQTFRQTHPTKFRTAYLIWKEPYMTVGGDTFISDMLDKAGFENVFSHQQRYPIIDVDDLRNVNCQLVFLSSEPYPFKQNQIDELQTQLPNTKCLLVDGEMFSWYGSRLIHSAHYFSELQFRIQAMM